MAAAIAVLILAASVLPNAAPSAADPSQDSEERQLLVLLNNYRTSNGRAALVLQEDLNEAADWYATDMATKNYFGSGQYCAQFSLPAHCDSLGRMPPARAKAFGYPQSVGENSAAGFCASSQKSAAQAVFDAWKGSSGHNANMLGSSYKSIGIGWAVNTNSKYKCYWVTDFGYYTGAGSSPGPSATASPTPQPTTPRAPTPTPTPIAPPTPTPEPTPATRVWDDINCDGRVTPEDAVHLLRGDLGFDDGGGGCPAVSELVSVEGAWLAWGDTDCAFGVQVLDSIKLLAFLAGVPFDDVNTNCPEPGTVF